MAKTDFCGNSPPLVSPFSKSIAHGTVDFIVVGGDAWTDGRTNALRLTAENFAHRLYGAPQKASGRAAPAEMNDTGNMLLPVVEDHRETISNEDTDENITLICDNRIAVDTLEVGDIRVGLVNHQDFTAVDLVDGQEQVWLQLKSSGHCSTVGLYLRELVA